MKAVVQEAPSVYRAVKLPSGLVRFFVKGGESAVDASLAGLTPLRLIQAIQAGLPVHEMEVLQEVLGIPMEKLASKVGISKATLHRRKATGRLDAAESDRVIRYARLVGRAVEVLESQENARNWLTSPQAGLGGISPLDYAETEVGAREVEDLLGRIEYGVYS